MFPLIDVKSTWSCVHPHSHRSQCQSALRVREPKLFILGSLPLGSTLRKVSYHFEEDYLVADAGLYIRHIYHLNVIYAPTGDAVSSEPEVHSQWLSMNMTPLCQCPPTAIGFTPTTVVAFVTLPEEVTWGSTVLSHWNCHPNEILTVNSSFASRIFLPCLLEGAPWTN